MSKISTCVGFRPSKVANCHTPVRNTAEMREIALSMRVLLGGVCCQGDGGLVVMPSLCTDFRFLQGVLIIFFVACHSQVNEVAN